LTFAEAAGYVGAEFLRLAPTSRSWKPRMAEETFSF